MESLMIGRDMFIRTTAPSGKSSVTQHRVWNAEYFLTSLQKQAVEQARKDNVKPAIIPATAEEYRNER